MGFLKPSIPAPPPAPPPPPDPVVKPVEAIGVDEREAEKRKIAARRKRGVMGTRKTGPGGISQPESVKKMSLLQTGASDES